MFWSSKFEPHKATHYFPLLPPSSREYRLDTDGWHIQDVNPVYMAVELPAITEWRGLGVIGCLIMILLGFGGMTFVGPEAYSRYSGEEGNLIDLMFLLAPLGLLLAGAFEGWRHLSGPLNPPVYFNRKTRKVYGWQKPRKGESGWFEYDWDRLIAVTSRGATYGMGGRATQYVLALLDVDPETNVIRRTFAAGSPGASLDPEKDWEYIRRYMNEEPGTQPQAIIALRATRDRKRRAISIHHELMLGSFDLETGKVTDRAYAILGFIGSFVGTYPLAQGTSWVRRFAKEPPMPPEMAAENHWEGGENPYKVTGDGEGPEAQARIDRIYDTIKWRHWASIVACPALVLSAAAYIWLTS